MSEVISICSKCRHYRVKNPVNPFTGIDVWTPEILAAKVEWEKEQAELALIEQQRFESGEEFDFEPINYSWCVRRTKEKNRYTIDPVSGRKSPIYILCARANADGQCTFFDPALK